MCNASSYTAPGGGGPASGASSEPSSLRLNFLQHLLIPLTSAPEAPTSEGAAQPRRRPARPRRACVPAHGWLLRPQVAGLQRRRRPALRHQLGTSGRSAPPHWDESFQHMKLDAVLSLHGEADDLIDEGDRGYREGRPSAMRASLCWAAPGDAPPPRQSGRRGQGRQDGRGPMLTPMAGTDENSGPTSASATGSRASALGAGPNKSNWTSAGRFPFAPGEFVLGYPQDSGANPYIAGPGSRVWPDEVRAFFRDGSFGVLHQMEQNVEAFDAFVAKAAAGNMEMSQGRAQGQALRPLPRWTSPIRCASAGPGRARRLRLRERPPRAGTAPSAATSVA